jgi:fructose-1,6-bisphosphatase
MTGTPTTFADFLREDQGSAGELPGALVTLLQGVERACSGVDRLVAEPWTTAEALTDAAEEIFVRALGSEGEGARATLSSTRREELLAGGGGSLEDERYLVAYEPLDDAWRVELHRPVGSMFSIRRASGVEAAADFLQPGTAQVAAGYLLFGSSTLLVLTLGRGVHLFRLDRSSGKLALTQRSLTMPAAVSELVVDLSRARWWEPPVRRYVNERLDDASRPSSRAQLPVHGISSLVADVHRILCRGGTLLVPGESLDPGPAASQGDGPHDGHLRLVHHAQPLAWLVEQAGGLASTGRERVQGLVPTDLRQCVPLILGTHPEVEQIEAYHRAHDDGLEPEFVSPLFNQRSLFPPSR